MSYVASSASRVRLWVVLIIVAVLCLLPATAHSEIVDLKTGDPAPYDGVLFDAAAIKKTVEDYRNAAADQARIQILRGEIELMEKENIRLRGQVAELQAEARSREIAQAVAAALDGARQEIEAGRKANEQGLLEVLERSRQTHLDALATMKALREEAAAAKSDAFWTKIGSFLLMILGLATVL